MKTRFNLFLFLLAAVIFTGCSSDDTVDTQKPTISVLEPHDDEEIAPGGEIHFEALFADNVALASYKIEIHNAFDDHTHATYKSAHTNPWSYSNEFVIPGGVKTFAAEQHIDVPTEINGAPISEGHYHFGVYVTDLAGNEQQAFLEVIIETGAGDHQH